MSVADLSDYLTVARDIYRKRQRHSYRFNPPRPFRLEHDGLAGLTPFQAQVRENQQFWSVGSQLILTDCAWVRNLSERRRNNVFHTRFTVLAHFAMDYQNPVYTLSPALHRVAVSLVSRSRLRPLNNCQIHTLTVLPSESLLGVLYYRGSHLDQMIVPFERLHRLVDGEIQATAQAEEMEAAAPLPRAAARSGRF